jgi:hypothetical protein
VLKNRRKETIKKSKVNCYYFTLLILKQNFKKRSSKKILLVKNYLYTYTILLTLRTVFIEFLTNIYSILKWV